MIAMALPTVRLSELTSRGMGERRISHQHNALTLIQHNRLAKTQRDGLVYARHIKRVEGQTVMASPSEKLAQSLEVLHRLQNANGTGAIRARDMTRTHRERLLASGFLQEVIKGWYIPSRPDQVRGESTAWYASFWQFAAAYLETRFRQNWCLSPEQSLSLHGGNWTVPRQLVARSTQGQKQRDQSPARDRFAGSARRIACAG